MNGLLHQDLFIHLQNLQKYLKKQVLQKIEKKIGHKSMFLQVSIYKKGIFLNVRSVTS